MSSFFERIILFLTILCTFSVIKCWNDREEHEQLSKLIQSFNQSLNIQDKLKEMNKTYYDIVETNDMDLLGRPEPDLKPIVDSFLKELREIQPKLEDFFKRFHWLNEKMMLKSIIRKFNCLEYENEIIALNETITMVIDQLMPYQIQNLALPSSRFDSKLLNKKLFEFRKEYPSYGDMTTIKKEIDFLDQEIKNFFNNQTKRPQLIESFQKALQHSKLINQRLDEIRQETFETARIHSQHIPVILDYNLVYSSQMHLRVWNMCQMYIDRIKIGADLSSASQTIRLENISMVAIILMIIINQWFR
ncbi:uncharacterized protein LOC113793431 [Dermatophagoides pteronyssinus]|uniref:uncharacterized protein LOC113793431 n=1 Tax=Dermatophagoides pteronyssinus TaxID=6956 RepID=UPI003F67E82A